MRPLWVEYPADTSTYALQDEFLLGSDILVKPVTKQGQSSVDVYFPGDQPWYDWVSSEVYRGGKVSISSPIHYIPYFQRGGSIIPTKLRPRRSSTQMEHDPYTLFVALDKKSEARGEIFIDDGYSFAYEKGTYIRRLFNISKSDSGKGLILQSHAVRDGKMYVRNKLERVIVRGIDRVSKVLLHILQHSEEEAKTVPLEFEYHQSTKNVIVRNPNVVVTHLHWKIEFLF